MNLPPYIEEPVKAQRWILMIMMPYYQINTMKYSWGNQEAEVFPPWPVIYFVSQQMLLSMKGWLQPLMIPFFSGEKINCKITLTFLSLISWFCAPQCAPDFMERSAQFVMRGDFGVETSCSNVGASLFWMELWINMLPVLFIWKWFINSLLVRT